MKLPNRFVAGLGILMISASSLLQAAPPDDRGPGPHDRGGPQQGPGPGDNPGRGHGPGAQGPQGERGGHRPPQDFGPVRQTIVQYRDVIGRGQPLPPGIIVARGKPLPPGYGKRLDRRALQHLPHYEGYEWRRLGTDVVLIAVGTGIVYAILDGVLN